MPRAERLSDREQTEFIKVRTTMKKSYITPQAKALVIDSEGLIATSPNLGMNAGARVGDAMPTNDDDTENFFSNGRDRGSMWE